MFRKDHIAIYGSTKVIRGWCEDCKGYSFVISGKIQCCDSKYDANPSHYRRMSATTSIRKKPSKKQQKEILFKQKNLCIYCEEAFGSYVRINDKTHQLIINWDHVIPFALHNDNSVGNFVAACQLCNSWKGSLVFKTLEDIKQHLQEEWKFREVKVLDKPKYCANKKQHKTKIEIKPYSIPQKDKEISQKDRKILQTQFAFSITIKEIRRLRKLYSEYYYDNFAWVDNTHNYED